MIQLPDVALPATTQEQLDKYQKEIDRLEKYPNRVAAAKQKFEQYNRLDNSTFRSIRKTLTIMCSGAKRCAYCEDSAADEVEHIRPKDLYPEHVFVWDNYVYACGPCNGPKNNRYAVFSTITHMRVEITRKRGDPIVEPEVGDAVFIDPRKENALDYMELDLLDTFLFLPTGQPGSINYERAEFTIDVLRLNDRDELPVARAEAYRSYRARLVEYIKHKEEGASQSQLDDLIAALQRMGHPTVWQEMKRQRTRHPELSKLFGFAPEALSW